MNLTFSEARIQLDGGVWLCLKVKEPALARQFVLAMKNVLYSLDIKEHRKKRSLNANAYMWELLDRLAESLGCTKEELYLEKVKSYGVCKDFALSPEDVSTFRTAWEMLGTAWPTEQLDYSPDGERIVVRAYYGSSQYNTKQMSRLIDAVVEDCKAMGIETLPPEKLDMMKEEWRGQHPAKQA